MLNVTQSTSGHSDYHLVAGLLKDLSAPSSHVDAGAEGKAGMLKEVQ